jgi:hypothetical protein
MYMIRKRKSQTMSNTAPTAGLGLQLYCTCTALQSDPAVSDLDLWRRANRHNGGSLSEEKEGQSSKSSPRRQKFSLRTRLCTNCPRAKRGKKIRGRRGGVVLESYHTHSKKPIKPRIVLVNGCNPSAAVLDSRGNGRNGMEKRNGA